MNANDSPTIEEEPVPLRLVEEALDVTQPDLASSGVGPWPFLASPGIAPSDPTRSAMPPHRSLHAASVT